MKIKNVVFDIGGVLAPFNWRETYEKLFKNDELELIANLTVMDTSTWNELDKGKLSYEEILQLFIKKSPKHEAKIRQAIDLIYSQIMPFHYAEPLVKLLKKNGFMVYALSNYGKVPFEKSLPRFTFMKYMDGSVISYEIQKIKPDPEIFTFFLKKYSLNPSECLFIDDKEENTLGASALGFNTLVFSSLKNAQKQQPNIFNGDFYLQ